MATNLKLDEGLLTDALKLGGFKTKKETVNNALKEFVQQRRRLQLIELEGQIDYFEDYDYKKAREA